MTTKKIKSIVAMALIISMVSCSHYVAPTPTPAQTYTPPPAITTVVTTANTQYVTKTSITQIPKLAFLNVDTKNKISGHAEERGNNANTELLKEQAVYNALKTNSADVLVEPAYKVTVTQGSGPIEISVDVLGFAGRYTEIRNINKDDEDMVENIKAFNNLLSMPNSNIKVVQTTNGKTNKK